MSQPNRFEELLERTLATGTIPADATVDERVELERLVAVARGLRASMTETERELVTARPAARARFQRHLAGAPAAATPSSARESLVTRVLGRGRRAFALASVASAAALVIAAFIVLPALFGDVDTATASVIEPGDYVQLEGVVGDDQDGGSVPLATGFGQLQLSVDSETSVRLDGSAVDGGAIEAGDEVVVSGIAREGGHIAARTIVIAGRGAPEPGQADFERLDEFREGLEGSVVAFALAADGETARVLLEGAQGHRFLVEVDATSAHGLLGQSSPALGAAVRVLPPERARVFSLEARGDHDGEDHGHPGPAGIRGLVTGADGNVMTVRTGRGAIEVEVSDRTRIITTRSDIDISNLAEDAKPAVGHGVAVSGAQDTGGRLLADVVVVGRDFSRDR